MYCRKSSRICWLDSCVGAASSSADATLRSVSGGTVPIDRTVQNRAEHPNTGADIKVHLLETAVRVARGVLRPRSPAGAHRPLLRPGTTRDYLSADAAWGVYWGTRDLVDAMGCAAQSERCAEAPQSILPFSMREKISPR
eukprot:2485839-Rhodomonas_salina.1